MTQDAMPVDAPEPPAGAPSGAPDPLVVGVATPLPPPGAPPGGELPGRARRALAGRTFNLAEIVGVVRELAREVELMRQERAAWRAEEAERTAAAIRAIASKSDLAVAGLYETAEKRAREIAVKIDERYADRFREMGETVAQAKRAMQEATHARELIGDAETRVSQGLAVGKRFDAKIDILAKETQKVADKLRREAGDFRAEIRKDLDKALGDAATALLGQQRDEKTLGLLGGRVQALENRAKGQVGGRR